MPRAGLALPRVLGCWGDGTVLIVPYLVLSFQCGVSISQLGKEVNRRGKSPSRKRHGKIFRTAQVMPEAARGCCKAGAR
jgi:hypothetical protein